MPWGKKLSRIIIRRDKLRHRVPYSDSQVWRLEKAGKFPQRIQLGPMAVGWYQHEIDDWINERVRGVGKAPPPRVRRLTAIPPGVEPAERSESR